VKIIVGLTHQEASAIKLAIMLREDIYNIGKAKPKGIRKVNHRLFLKDLFFSFWDKSIKRQIQTPKQTKKDKKPRAKSIIIFVRGSVGVFILGFISFIFSNFTRERERDKSTLEQWLFLVKVFYFFATFF